MRSSLNISAEVNFHRKRLTRGGSTPTSDIVTMNKWRLLFALFAVFHPTASFTSSLVDGRQCSDRRQESRPLLYGSYRKNELPRIEVRDAVRSADGFRKAAEYRVQDSERELTRQIVASRRVASVERVSRDRDSLLREAHTDVRATAANQRRTEPRTVRDSSERVRFSNDRQGNFQIRSDERSESGRIQSRQVRADRDRRSGITRGSQSRRFQENANRQETRRILERDNVDRRSARDDSRFTDERRGDLRRNFRSESERRSQDARMRSVDRQGPLNVRVDFRRVRDSPTRDSRFQSDYRLSTLARSSDQEFRHERFTERTSRISRQRYAVSVRERDDTTEVRDQGNRHRAQVSRSRSNDREERTGRSIRTLDARAERRQSVERRTRDGPNTDRLHVTQRGVSERKLDTRMLYRQDNVRNSRNKEIESRDVARIGDSDVRSGNARVAERLSRSGHRGQRMERDVRMSSRLQDRRESRTTINYERRDARMNDARKLPMKRDSVFYRSERLSRGKQEAEPHSYNWSLWLYTAQGAYFCYMLLKLAGEKKLNKMRSRNLWFNSAPKLVKVD